MKRPLDRPRTPETSVRRGSLRYGFIIDTAPVPSATLITLRGLPAGFDEQCPTGKPLTADIGRRSHDVVAITIEPLDNRQISETALAASPVQHCNNINGLGDQGAGTVTTAS